ncbi:MAG: SH3 domain-containing protein [Deltaproteobacteria bacterium]|nr:SH3 domain-containing protein [Deltaproteobacteria bacterium]
MSRTTRGNFVSWSTFMICLTVFGCKGREMAGPDDLPDLNKQIRSYTTVENTRVRTGPGPQFRATGEIPAKAKVHVVGRDGDWLLIVSKVGNTPGFIEMTSIEPGASAERESPSHIVAGKYEILANTRVYSGPGLQYPVVTKISKGTIINVIEEEKGWVRVESKRGNKPGYVEASLAKPATNR